MPIAVLAAGLIAFFAFGLHHYIGYEVLSAYHEDLETWVANHRVLAAFAFVIGYVAMVAFSLPGATLATMLGGFLFGTLLAAVLVVIGATIGATILFLAARTAFADILHAKAGPYLGKMEQGFRNNAFYYLLFLRLVPVFPFWLVNLVPAFLGVSLRTFVICTHIGIIPGTLLYAWVGEGLGDVLEKGEAPDFDIILEPQFLLPLIALGVLALIPVIYKSRKSRKN